MNIKYRISERIKGYLLRNDIEAAWLILRSRGMQEMAKAYCELNCSGLPSCLIDWKPKYEKWGRPKSNWNDLRFTFSITLMRRIENNIGKKETSRYWNTIHSTYNPMTNEEFETWWSLRDNFEAQFNFTSNRINPSKTA